MRLPSSKNIQDAAIGGQFSEAFAAQTEIKVKTGLLPPVGISSKRRLVLAERQGERDLPAKPALRILQAFFLAVFPDASLVHGSVSASHQGFDDQRKERLEAGGKARENGHRSKSIAQDAGQLIGFAEDQSQAVGAVFFRQRAPSGHRRQDPGANQVFIDLNFWVMRQKPHQNFGSRAGDPTAHESAFAGDHFHQGTR